jgi:O-succinylbenzoate synthase
MTHPEFPIDGVEIREVRLPLRRSYRSASTSLNERHLLVVALHSGSAVGWGECGPVPGYSAETIEECRAGLLRAARHLTAGGAGDETTPATVRFALGSAVADVRGQLQGRPCWQTIGGADPGVEIGAVIGIDPEGEELVVAAEALAAEGYRRIKLKVAPGRCLDRTRLLRTTLPDSDLAVDANGSFLPDDDAELRGIDDLGLLFIEQPYPARAGRMASELAAEVATPICLDESIADLRDAAVAANSGLGWVLNVKLARVGGIETATLITAMATAAGLGVWTGGMLESGIGKAAALAVATLPGMTMAAELGPSRRHFETDLVTWRMDEGRLRAPDRPGLGIEIDVEALDRFTTAVETVGAGF